MSTRLLLIAGLLSLATGCSTSSKAAAWRASTAGPSADPQRWDRWACFRGDVPVGLDSRAYARARLEDLQATRQDGAGPSATARLLDQRVEFEARCDRWRREVSLAAPVRVDRWSGI